MMIRLLTGFVSTKFISYFLGPQGIAVLENLRNFISTIESLCSLGFQNGTLKLIAEQQGNKIEVKKIVATSVLTLLCTTILLGLILLLTGSYWNVFIFSNAYDFKSVIFCIAIACPFYALNYILISILNGMQYFKKVVYINIFGHLISLLLTVVLIYYFGLIGALFSAVIAPIALNLFSFYMIQSSMNFLGMLRLEYVDKLHLKHLLSFTLMALFSGVLGPLVLMRIRSEVTEVINLDAAGIWSAMGRISSYYMLFLTSIIGLYFYPKIIHSKNVQQFGRVFKSYLMSIGPLFLLGLTLLYFLRTFVVRLLFSNAFTAVEDLFIWQLGTDLVKLFSLFLGYYLLANKKTVPFIIGELISYGSFYLLSVILLSNYNIAGVMMGQLLSNILYLIFVICVIFNDIRVYKNIES